MKTAGPIVAAVDFSEESTTVVHHATALARGAGVGLVVVHVIDSGILRHHAISAGRSPQESALLSQAEDRLRAMISKSEDHLTVQVEVVCDHPLDGIHHALKKTGPSLLVIGTNDLTKERLGSIASSCLRTAPCDVLVLRDWQGTSFERILVCVDFSPASSRALERGVSLAHLYNSKINIVYVMYPPSRNISDNPATTDCGDESIEGRCRRMVDGEMERFLEGFAEILAGVSYTVTILKGVSPGVSLVDYIKNNGVDLAILGSKSRSQIPGVFSASAAEHAISETTTSILVTREKS